VVVDWLPPGLACFRLAIRPKWRIYNELIARLVLHLHSLLHRLTPREAN